MRMQINSNKWIETFWLHEHCNQESFSYFITKFQGFMKQRWKNREVAMLRKIRKPILCILLLWVTVCSISGCSRNKIPETVPEIITEIYENMTDLKSYSMVSTLTMDMELSKNPTKVEVITKVGLSNHPFEVTIVNDSSVENVEKEETYLYCIQEEDGVNVYCYDNGEWLKTKPEVETVEALKNQYASPIEFDLYFLNIDSFTISEQTEEETILVGTVNKENVVSILKETGVLRQLSLTSLPEESLVDLQPIEVKVWVDNETVCITKFEVDMTNTYQNITTLLFNEESYVNPVINQCILTIEQITVGEQADVDIPEAAQKALEELTKKK